MELSDEAYRCIATPSSRSARASCSRVTSSSTSSPVTFGARARGGRNAAGRADLQLGVAHRNPRRAAPRHPHGPAHAAARVRERGTWRWRRRGVRRAIPYFAPAYRATALTNEALLGVEPDRDIQASCEGGRTSAALADDPRALEELVADLNRVARALASRDQALAASVPALRDTLRVGLPALDELTEAFRRCAPLRARRCPASARPPRPSTPRSPGSARRRPRGARRAGGLVADLHSGGAKSGAAGHQAGSAARPACALSSCTSRVLVPFGEAEIPSIEAANGQEARQQILRSFVGLAGEPRQRRQLAGLPRPGSRTGQAGRPDRPHRARGAAAAAKRPGPPARTWRARRESRRTWRRPGIVGYSTASRRRRRGAGR